MYTALYRAQRPEIFSEILGQEHIVKILKHQIATDSINHAYLFCGTRGTGKTTTARILAKAVNCLGEGQKPCGQCANCMSIKDGNFMDVIEIDAASNNGVENIRELRESVKYPPAVGRKKVYIIDEVHMLSTGAFNALLKTLEEPPEYVIFILATTEPQKLPATILSRCMRLDFKRVPQNILMEGMRKICQEKEVSISESALKLLASCADGSVRDGLSILDQVLASGEKNIERENILEYIGAAGEDFFIELTDLVSLKKVAEALVLLDGALADGKDVKQLMKDWTAHYRNLLITKFIKSPEDIINMSTENIKRIQKQSEHISLDEINDAIIRLSKTINDARWSTQPRILLELAIVAIATDMVEDGVKTRHEMRRPIGETMTAASASDKSLRQSAYGISSNEEKADTKRPQNIEDNSYTQDIKSSSQEPANMQALQGEEDTDFPPEIDRASAETNVDMDNERLWHEVFEAGEDEAGSFNLIRNGTALRHVGDGNFTVFAKSTFIKKYAEQKRDEIERIMSHKLGRPMRMLCYAEGEKIQGDGAETVYTDDTQELARKASDILGIDIEIE